MVQELVHSGNTSEATADSLAELRSLMRQVEAELHHSLIYERVLSSLQSLPAEMGLQVQRMVNAIGREAIRLSFRQRVDQNLESSARPGEGFAVPPLPPPRPKLVAIEPGAASAAPKAPSSASARTEAPPMQQRRRLSKRELAAQAAQQAWEERLRELGAEIRQVRQSTAQTTYHLHLKTQVPLHQIEALESGQIDRLPEDVYVRGFLRRLGCALNLDGIALAASLPPLDPVQAILPTWYQPKAPSGSGLRPLHLYVGYAALMAGGFTWLAHQSDLKEPPQPAPSIAPPTQAPANKAAQSTRLSPPTISVSLPEQVAAGVPWEISGS